MEVEGLAHEGGGHESIRRNSDSGQSKLSPGMQSLQQLCSPVRPTRSPELTSALGSRAVAQVLKRYKDRKQARALIREFEMSASANVGSSRPSGRAIGDSGVSGWTGVDGSLNGQPLFAPVL